MKQVQNLQSRVEKYIKDLPLVSLTGPSQNGLRVAFEEHAPEIKQFILNPKGGSPSASVGPELAHILSMVMPTLTKVQSRDGKGYNMFSQQLVNALFPATK